MPSMLNVFFFYLLLKHWVFRIKFISIKNFFVSHYCVCLFWITIFLTSFLFLNYYFSQYLLYFLNYYFFTFLAIIFFENKWDINKENILCKLSYSLWSLITDTWYQKWKIILSYLHTIFLLYLHEIN